MTRAESLAHVVAVMPPGYARDVIRATLKGWPEEDVAAWHRLKDNERKQIKRDNKKAANVRSSAPQETGQVPVSIEAGDRTSSGLPHGNKPDITPSPQVPPLHPPSSPAPAPSHTHTREAKPKTPKPEEVEVPEQLSSLPRFSPVWLTFLDMRRLIKHPMTHHAASIALNRLTERPSDAIELLELATERQWQGLRWGLLDKERAENTPGHFIERTVKHVNGSNGHQKKDESDIPLRYRTGYRD